MSGLFCICEWPISASTPLPVLTVLKPLTGPRRALCRLDYGQMQDGYVMASFLWRRFCPIAKKSNDMVRISSRKWTFAQIEELSALIAAGSTAANAAMTLRRSITVVRAKARNLGTPFQMIAEHRRV